MIQKRLKSDWRKTLGIMIVLGGLGTWSHMGVAGPLPLKETGAKPKARTRAAKPARKTADKSTVSKKVDRPTESNLRDPFKIPPIEPEVADGQVQNGGGIPIIGPLPPGPKGLIIDQVKLEGIVSQPKGNPTMIAVLANSTNRAFFLHENDALFNGVITKITPDSVYFREDYRDAEGKMSSREVIKKMPPASGVKP